MKKVIEISWLVHEFIDETNVVTDRIYQISLESLFQNFQMLSTQSPAELLSPYPYGSLVVSGLKFKFPGVFICYGQKELNKISHWVRPKGAV